jgi:hypothetical protein
MKTRRTWAIFILGTFLLAACGIWSRTPAFAPGGGPRLEGPTNAANGERIYFTATSARGASITYRDGPDFGGMMMGSYLTCASCHGPNARGGVHQMHMQVMDAPDITYTALSGEAEEHAGDEHGEDEHGDEHSGEYTLDTFRKAVIEGKHPDGDPLDEDMPRWQMSDEDLADLFEFLKAIQ